MSSPHYSLRWNNHQSHLLTAFDSLLQNETLVDVTLVCEESTFKAHKVVLSACSPYFQRIFSETPCKHPVIVLKDLRGWEVQAIVDFMYRGEISVGQEQLSSLIKAAESLQVRGLAHTERIPVLPSEKREPQNQQRCYSPTTTPPHHQQFNGPQPHQHPHQNPPHSMRLPQIPHLPNISFSEMPERHCTSPMPRRKQVPTNKIKLGIRKYYDRRIGGIIMGRPKGQHSAPRGGPPRSWTNAELTEALQHVWNKKMTTSQASRIFGIPYNSLLMYVRGKYGKSLKLEQLKKECFGELGGSPLDLLGLGNIASNNNNPPMGGGGGHNQKLEQCLVPAPLSIHIRQQLSNDDSTAPTGKQAGTKLPPDPPPPEHLMMPGFNPAAYPPVPANFYPDFASFPIPVGMVHLLPQSEKNREPPPTSVASVMDAVDYTKGDPSENRRDSSPLDFATKEEHLRNRLAIF
ncbi:unnamed protein product [Nesidiocoris tenuis]|uniref:BTB domain-containing protein n=1 Tax=Nesidiocoris tenuis TaxID=355587 RepID=A0A6H5HM74_9HEMI|nr:unnamed protein product [Nesidiocoris tenuis]